MVLFDNLKRFYHIQSRKEQVSISEKPRPGATLPSDAYGCSTNKRREKGKDAMKRGAVFCMLFSGDWSRPGAAGKWTGKRMGVSDNKSSASTSATDSNGRVKRLGNGLTQYTIWSTAQDGTGDSSGQTINMGETYILCPHLRYVGWISECVRRYGTWRRLDSQSSGSGTAGSICGREPGLQRYLFRSVAVLEPKQNMKVEQHGNEHGQTWYQQVTINFLQRGLKIFIGQQQADVKR